MLCHFPSGCEFQAVVDIYERRNFECVLIPRIFNIDLVRLIPSLLTHEAVCTMWIGSPVESIGAFLRQLRFSCREVNLEFHETVGQQ